MFDSSMLMNDWVIEWLNDWRIRPRLVLRQFYFSLLCRLLFSTLHYFLSCFIMLELSYLGFLQYYLFECGFSWDLLLVLLLLWIFSFCSLFLFRYCTFIVPHHFNFISKDAYHLSSLTAFLHCRKVWFGAWFRPRAARFWKVLCLCLFSQRAWAVAPAALFFPLKSHCFICCSLLSAVQADMQCLLAHHHTASHTSSPKCFSTAWLC